MVETFGSEVGPYGTILPAVHLPLLEPLEHEFLAFEICVRFIIYLVEVHTKTAVGLVEAGIDPVVHHLPESAHLGIPLLPSTEHTAGLLHERTLLLGFFLGNVLPGHDFFHFLLEMPVESHIEVSDKMVSLLAGAVGSGSFAPFLPCQHRLADVYAAVVDNVGLHNLVAVGLQYLRQRIAEQIVADMTEMQGLVGVGRGILHHHQIGIFRDMAHAELRVGGNVMKHTEPPCGIDGKIQESLHHIETFHSRLIRNEPLSYPARRIFRLPARYLKIREHHNRHVTLKLFLCRSGIDRRRIGLRTVQILYGKTDGT